MVPFVFPILGEDPEEARFGGVVDSLAVFPALDPACRFIIALAPACALAELSPDPCVVLLAPARLCADLLAPARVEEFRVPVARVTALTLLTVPSALAIWLVILCP